MNDNRRLAVIGVATAVLISVVAGSPTAYAVGPGVVGGLVASGTSGTAATTPSTGVTGTGVVGGARVLWGGAGTGGCAPGQVLVGWNQNTLGAKPSDAALNAGIAAGTVVISPAPLPNGGNGYTWQCHPTQTITGLATPPTAPVSFNVGNAVVPADGTLVLSENTILVGDTVTGTVSATPQGGLSVTGTAAPDFQYDYELRWVPKQADKWDWQDPSGTLTTASAHQYTHVSGVGGVPGLPGLTVTMFKYWVPECSGLITEGAPPAALKIVLSQGFGTYPCSYPPGQSAATFIDTQTFTENSPPAPHLVYQVEPVGGK